MRVVLDAQNMQMRTETFAYLKNMLQLPEYFGGNLDALYDCLTEAGETTIMIEHTESAGEFFPKVFRVMMDAARENDELTVICCGQDADELTETCCGQDVDELTETCCGQDADESTETCCGQDADESTETCCGQDADESTEICCGQDDENTSEICCEQKEE